MGEGGGKLFKTKLCVLYEKGNCSRQSCSFAHGDAELRRYSTSASFNGRRDRRGNDLRDRLERRRSPQRRYSPRRDVRPRDTLHGHKQLHHDRGYSSSRSPTRSEKRRKKKQHLDGENDISGSLKVSDGSDGIKERQAMCLSAKYELEEKLKQVQLDVDMLENHKTQLEVNLEKKDQEADSLVSRIAELETQLEKEQQDCKRTASTIKKFIKVHCRYSKAQEELKRSQARLQKLGEQLAVDASRPNGNEDYSGLNIGSDGELNVDSGMSPRSIRQTHPSSSKKRSRTSHGDCEEKTAILKYLVGPSASEKHTKVDRPATQLDNNCKESDVPNRILSRSNGLRSVDYEDNNKQRKNSSRSIDSMEKVKGLDPGHMLPLTCMAAQAVNELIDADEMRKTEVFESATTVLEKSTPRDRRRFSYLPLPPPPPRAPGVAYKQYEGDDVDIDVEDLDVEALDGDINNEVDIEQL